MQELQKKKKTSGVSWIEVKDRV